MQGDPKDGSYCHGAKVPIGDRISRGVGKVKDKIESNKGADLKSPSVTQPIMSLRRKDEKEGYETFEEPKSHTFGGNPSGLLFLFKYLKVRSDKGFFPGKTCNLMLVRGTISFYDQRLQILPVGESVMWNISM